MPSFRQAMASGRIKILGIQPPVLAPPPITQEPQTQLALSSPTGNPPPQTQLFPVSFFSLLLFHLKLPHFRKFFNVSLIIISYYSCVLYVQQPSVPPSLPQLRAMQMATSHPGFTPSQSTQIRPPPIIPQQPTPLVATFAAPSDSTCVESVSFTHSTNIIVLVLLCTAPNSHLHLKFS